MTYDYSLLAGFVTAAKMFDDTAETMIMKHKGISEEVVEYLMNQYPHAVRAVGRKAIDESERVFDDLVDNEDRFIGKWTVFRYRMYPGFSIQPLPVQLPSSTPAWSYDHYENLITVILFEEKSDRLKFMLLSELDWTGKSTA